MMKTFLTACDPWGVSVERVEVKNLSVAREMVKSLAVEAQASREVRETERERKSSGSEKCII